MSSINLSISPLSASQLGPFHRYLQSQLADNGLGDTPWFHPVIGRDNRLSNAQLQSITEGYDAPLDAQKWRRFWLVVDATDAIAAHIDLRSYNEINCAHRVLLGMGMLPKYRYQGLGKRLMTEMLDWTRTQPHIEWIDLCVVDGNEPAIRLYQNFDFIEQVNITDRFRVDGVSYGYRMMTKRLNRD